MTLIEWLKESVIHKPTQNASVSHTKRTNAKGNKTQEITTKHNNIVGANSPSRSSIWQSTLEVAHHVLRRDIPSYWDSSGFWNTHNLLSLLNQASSSFSQQHLILSYNTSTSHNGGHHNLSASLVLSLHTLYFNLWFSKRRSLGLTLKIWPIEEDKGHFGFTHTRHLLPVRYVLLL